MKKNIQNASGAGTSAMVSKNISRRVLAVLLALVFVASCFLGVNFALRAKGDEWTAEDMAGEQQLNEGLILNKGLRKNGDTYEVRLEAKATGSAVNQTLPENSPLDIAVVKDTGTKMADEDVKNGNYTTHTPSFSVNDIETAMNNGDPLLYLADDGKYYPVKCEMDKSTYLPVEQTADGTAITSWTAQTANSWYKAQGADLYLDNNGAKRIVTTYDAIYSKRSSSRIDILSEVDHSYFTGHYYSTNYYVYVPHDSSTADGSASCWHRVYYREDGYTLDGYYYTFYYYKNSLEGSGASFSSGNAGSTQGSGSSAVVLLNNYQSCACSGTSFTGYSIKSGKSNFTNSTSNGTNGNLYTVSTEAANNKTKLNILKVDKGEFLACQSPSSSTSDSHEYKGTFYANGYKLYYESPAGKQYLNDTPVLYKTDTAYTGTLYTAGKITRTAAMNSAIDAFKAQLDANGLDYHYSEVDYNDNLSTGLTNAKNWLDSHKSEGRKQIVVLFSDDVATADTTNVAQALKNTGVTIYTVGLYPDGTNSTVNDALKAVSSETFNGTTAAGTFNYSATDKDTLEDVYKQIANAVKTPSTTLTLGSTTVLRDILSSNFITDDPNDKNGKTKVTIETVDASGNVTKNPVGVTYEWGSDEKTLNVTGFDYCANPNTTLRVTITGLDKVYKVTPETVENPETGENEKRIYSNDPNSGIYIDNGTNLFAAFPRPFIPYDEATADVPELHSMNVAIREEFTTLTDIISTISGTANFQAKLLEVDGISAEDSAQWDCDPTIYDNEVTLPAVTLSSEASAYDDNDGIADSHEWSTGIIFPDGNVYAEDPATDTRFTFPHAGVYLYEVTQTGLTLTDAVPNPDTTHYFMKVFVRNSDKKNGEEANGLYIENITVRKGNSDEATTKVNYTTDGSDTNEFVFQNQYFPERKGTLTVKKEMVASDADANPLDDADRAKEFEFSLTVTLSETIAERTQFSLPDITNTNFREVSIRRLSDSTSPIVMITGKIRLKPGDEVKLENLPMNAKYTFTENGIPEDKTVQGENGEQQTWTNITPIPTSEDDATSAGVSYFCEEPRQTGTLESEAETATITNQKVSFVMQEPEGIHKSVSLGVAGAVIAVILLAAGALFLRIKLKEEQ